MIEVNIQELEDYLTSIKDKTKNLKPIMHTIGEKVKRVSLESFEKEQDPITSRAWSPISSTSLFAQTGGKKKAFTKNKKSHTKSFKNKIDKKRLLIKEGDLFKSIDYEATKDSSEIYASKVYAATHFFGDNKRNIKQRRYMPFTDSLDLPTKLKDELIEDITDYLLDEKKRT
ncbi:phage virion morphogenesis protein [Aliarcobacter vitoriensis]|uniref:Phage virion morphogenesis protein n=1 Tax=Aliarcobacter vitoriensis TaxID=2011099 RepID=A0A366MQ34_9BACT|nr:phage virion morphogenesis protein [Aliarcobacter vitoriensis]RBQ28401.1 hypothetical protein CRU91_09275 [Aliarcobacter vitoriensis]